MRRFAVMITLITSLLAPVAITSSPALAVDVLSSGCAGKASSASVCKDAKNAPSQNTIIIIIRDVIDFISLIVGISAVIMIIIAALRMVMSGGEVKDAESARSSIIYALAGLLVVAFAQMIVVFFLNKFK